MFDPSLPTLALDCSVQKITLAIIKNHKVLSSYNAIPPDSQSMSILKIIDDTLNQAKIKVDQISQVLFCNGPGSFTSLRIALSTLKGLFWERDILFAQTSSLLFRCLSSQTKGYDKIIATVSLGRKRLAVGIVSLNQKNDNEFFKEKLFSPDEFGVYIQNLSDQRLSLSGKGLDGLGLTGDIKLEDVTDPTVFLKILNKKLYNITSLDSAPLNYK